MRKRSKKRSNVEARDDRWRRAVKKEYGIYCVVCGHPSIGIDHTWGKQDCPQWRWVLENGRPLCDIFGHNCHDKKHNDPDFNAAYFEQINADGMKEEFLRGVGTIID